MKKGFIMLFVAMTMLLCLPLVANAEIVEQGNCGTDVTYTLDDQGTLTISGTGEMTNLSYASATPWYSNRSTITNVIVENGVTHLGNYIFCGCENLVSATLPETVTSFGFAAFSDCTNLESINIPDGVTSITASAFEKCRSLTSIIIPENVTSIGVLKEVQENGLKPRFLRQTQTML